MEDKGLDAAYLRQMLNAGSVDVDKSRKVTSKAVQAGSAVSTAQESFVVVEAVRGFQDSHQGTETDLILPS